MEYNGIKFFASVNGYKLPDELEDRIEGIVLDGKETMPVPTGIEVGQKGANTECGQRLCKILKRYNGYGIEWLENCFGLCQWGFYEAAPMVFESLGAEVIITYHTPDGTNINDYCGSTHPEKLQSLVLETGADAGLAFDGDAGADCCKRHGNLVDGDQIMLICGLDMKNRRLLKQNTVVGTVMSNLGLENALKSAGCRLEKTRVGDRYVLEKMLEEGYNLAANNPAMLFSGLQYHRGRHFNSITAAGRNEGTADHCPSWLRI